MFKNFKASDMDCHDGTAVPEKYHGNRDEVLRRMQILRDFFGKPISIRSGYRTEKHNARVGGEKLSQHLTASAADFVVEGVSPSQVREAVEGLIRIGALPECGLGTYITFTHLDIRAGRYRWRG